MLEDDGRIRTITTKGVSWHGRHYVAVWMTGQVGQAVRVRHMPHHEHEIEVFDADTSKHLGAATWPTQPARIRSPHCTKPGRHSVGGCEPDLRAAEKTRRVRYAAATEAAPPQPVQAVTAQAAQAELASSDDAQLQAVARSDLFAPGPPAPAWVLPHSPGPAGSHERAEAAAAECDLTLHHEPAPGDRLAGPDRNPACQLLRQSTRHRLQRRPATRAPARLLGPRRTSAREASISEPDHPALN